MGRDNQPKHRQRAQLERKKNQRASYDRILIVSEGTKTEPNYFLEIRSEYRLHSANVEVHPSALGTQPIQVVEYAQTLFEQGDLSKGIQPRAFEHVFAVFDRDDHPTFYNAISKAEALDGKLRNDLRKPVSFAAIPSRPSFEFWLLLHFEDVRHLMHRDEVIRRLRTHLPEYEKGYDYAFANTRSALPTASARAKILATPENRLNDDEPYTTIYELIEVLVKLRG
jgi:hypothetical protein